MPSTGTAQGTLQQNMSGGQRPGETPGFPPALALLGKKARQAENHLTLPCGSAAHVPLGNQAFSNPNAEQLGEGPVALLLPNALNTGGA